MTENVERVRVCLLRDIDGVDGCSGVVGGFVKGCWWRGQLLMSGGGVGGCAVVGVASVVCSGV